MSTPLPAPRTGHRGLHPLPEGPLVVLVDGGGMRSVITAGMVAALEDAGVTERVVAWVACSGGALNAAFAAAGQAREGTRAYPDAVAHGLFQPRRVLRGGAALDVRWLTETFYRDHYALRTDLVAEADLRVVVTDLTAAARPHPSPDARAAAASREVRLHGASDAQVRRVLAATCLVGGVAGRPLLLDGVPCCDGALACPFPLHQLRAAAAELGASPVVLLGTAVDEVVPRAPSQSVQRAAWLVGRSIHPGMAALSPSWFSRKWDTRQEILDDPAIAVVAPAEPVVCGRGEKDLARLQEACASGERAVAQVLTASTPPHHLPAR